MKRALGHMPNYLCSESITRSIGDGTSLHYSTGERLPLQVAIVGGKEVYSGPGSEAFEGNDPRLSAAD
ncbi:MAG: hypothetical protein JWP63_3430 [Candidatus Solibacter sp.]|nr:hypothetical protein [Candidatus Solibacter sp.]